LESEFVEKLKDMQLAPGFVKVFKETMMEVWREKVGRHEQDQVAIERRLKELRIEKEGTISLKAKGLLSDEEFIEQRDRLNNQIAAEGISLSETNIDKYDIEALLVYAEKRLTDLPKLWQEIENKPGFQKFVFPRGIPYRRGSGFGTAEIGLIFKLNRDYRTNKSCVVEMGGVEPPSQEDWQNALQA